MARKKYRRRRKRKRTRKRKPYIPNLLGNSTVTRMKFCKGFVLNPGAGLITSRVFRANGITFCDTTGTNGQPTGFDQFNAFFNKYKILESRIRMTWVPTVSTSVNPSAFGVFQDDDATLAYADYQQLLMGNQSRGRIKLAGLIDGNSPMQSVTAKYNPKKTYRLGGSQELDLYGDGADNPIETQQFQCYAASPDISSDPGNTHYLVEIDYVVLWTDKLLTILSQSP